MGSTKSPESFDVIVIGAGVAGINASYRLQSRLPNAKFTVLEATGDIGGTWQLFKYPGIRSDSDLVTYGFPWESWPYETPIAEGHLIISYLRSCIEKHNLARHFRFHETVRAAHWSSDTRKWTLTIETAENGVKTYETQFLLLGTGYYDHHNPAKVDIPGLERFQGKVAHPQFWPTDYDFANKDIVVIGSGATAITLIPALARTAKHVTMLQRSPSYVAPIDNTMPFDKGWWRVVLPVRRLRDWANWAYFAFKPYYSVVMARAYPEAAKAVFEKAIGALLPPDISTDPHFRPRYDPWQQRVCLSPNADFFQCLHPQDGKPAKAGVVTAKIRTVTEEGIVCEDGQELKTDVIVTATGLKMLWGAGIPFWVDGEKVDIAQRPIWDGAMVEGVPNMMYMAGYAWASWTVGADNTAIMLCRLLNDMKKRGEEVAVPRYTGPKLTDEDKQSWCLLSSTYVVNDKTFPFNIKGGTGPWKARGNVWLDWLDARLGNLRKSLAFS